MGDKKGLLQDPAQQMQWAAFSESEKCLPWQVRLPSIESTKNTLGETLFLLVFADLEKDFKKHLCGDKGGGALSCQIS